MKNIVEWIQAATRPILLKKDREQAAQELEDHFEDHCSVLTARGLSLVQAEQEALAAMGDAKETGRLLRQAYQPVLSVLWKISRWVLGLSIAALVISFLMKGFSLQTSPEEKAARENTIREMEERYDPSRGFFLWGKGTNSARVGLYRIRVEKAGIKKMEGEQTAGLPLVLIRLWVDHPFWMNYASNLSYYLYAEDDLGNKYPNYNTLVPPYDPPHLFGSINGYSSGRDYLELILAVPDTPDERMPHHIDLIYDHAGCSFTIGVDFGEEMP